LVRASLPPRPRRISAQISLRSGRTVDSAGNSRPLFPVLSPQTSPGGPRQRQSDSCRPRKRSIPGGQWLDGEGETGPSFFSDPPTPPPDADDEDSGPPPPCLFPFLRSQTILVQQCTSLAGRQQASLCPSTLRVLVRQARSEKHLFTLLR